jgi:hypothetical protein
MHPVCLSACSAAATSPVTKPMAPTTAATRTNGTASACLEPGKDFWGSFLGFLGIFNPNDSIFFCAENPDVALSIVQHNWDLGSKIIPTMGFSSQQKSYCCSVDL